MPAKGSEQGSVAVELIDDRVHEVRIAAEGANEVIDTSEAEIRIELPNGVPYEEFRDEYQPSLKQLSELVSVGAGEPDVAKRWQQVYQNCQPRGKVILRTILQEGEETSTGMRVSYDSLISALEADGYEVSSQTLSGIFRGVNPNIEQYLPEVSDSDEILYQEHQNGKKYRILRNRDDGVNHPNELRKALSTLGVSL